MPLTIWRDSWADTARNAVGVPLADHDVSIYLLQVYNIPMHMPHRLLQRHEVLDHDLKVLVQVKDLAFHDAHAIVEVSLKGSTLHELGHVIDLAIFSQLYDLTIQLLKLLFKLFVPRYHFFSDQLFYLDFRSK